MDQADQGVLNALSSHEKREVQRKAKEEAREHKESAEAEKEKRKSYLWITVTIIVLVVFATGVVWLYTHKKATYTEGPIHWHALLDVNICGEKRDIRGGKVSGNMGGNADNAMYGPPLLHHHNDNTIHIEGQVFKKEDIQLGKFFDGIDIPFDKDKIMDKKNGDLCPDGRPGVLKMYVNDQPRTDFREYVPFAVSDARKQVIKLVFEPEGGMSANVTTAGVVTNATTANATNASS